jgi:hypothetical protein
MSRDPPPSGRSRLTGATNWQGVLLSWRDDLRVVHPHGRDDAGAARPLAPATSLARRHGSYQSSFTPKRMMVGPITEVGKR